MSNLRATIVSLSLDLSASLLVEHATNTVQSCSVACNRTHKQTPCSAPPSAPTKFPARANAANPPSEELLLTAEQLAILDTDPEVTRKTAHSRVLAAIARVDSAADRAAALEKEMQDPTFVELCDDVLAALGKPRADAHEEEGRA